MPKPSYTIDTLRELRKLYADREFSILIGSDNLDALGAWKDSQELLRDYKIWCYPREGYVPKLNADKVVMLEGAPMFDFSSTEVRAALVDCRDVSEMVSPDVAQYIYSNGLWGCRLAQLDKRISEGCADAETYVERGKHHHRNGDLHLAMNDFIAVREMDLSDDLRSEVEQLIEMIERIFEFRYTDIYNP